MTIFLAWKSGKFPRKSRLRRRLEWPQRVAHSQFGTLERKVFYTGLHRKPPAIEKIQRKHRHWERTGTISESKTMIFSKNIVIDNQLKTFQSIKLSPSQKYISQNKEEFVKSGEVIRLYQNHNTSGDDNRVVWYERAVIRVIPSAAHNFWIIGPAIERLDKEEKRDGGKLETPCAVVGTLMREWFKRRPNGNGGGQCPHDPLVTRGVVWRRWRDVEFCSWDFRHFTLSNYTRE